MNHENMPGTNHDNMPDMPGMKGMDHCNMPGMNHDQMAGMDMSYSAEGGPFHTMGGEGSGTSWMPASTPVYGKMYMKGNWMFMLHGQELIRFNDQTGPRGADAINAQGWFMFMGDHKLGAGTFQFRTMFSPDPIFQAAPDPELFQHGETYHGQPIIDGQHPHNLFAELAAEWTVPVSKNFALQLYGGPVGEPALGPTAFMHRPIIGVPLGHHNEDSTHISEGVATVGVIAYKFKVEGSLFHGEEPGENRFGIYTGGLDSWSTRVSFAPTRDWTMQVSHGELHKPEALEPGNQSRTTASLQYNHALNDKTNIASALIWGRTRQIVAGTSNAYTFETMLTRGKTDLFTRLELLDVDGLLQTNIFDEPAFVPSSLVGDPARPFRVGAFSYGAVRDFYTTASMRLGFGGSFSTYHVPELLVPTYSAHPIGFQLFLRVRFGKI
jgi:hypothetical protein